MKKLFTVALVFVLLLLVGSTFIFKKQVQIKPASMIYENSNCKFKIAFTEENYQILTTAPDAAATIEAINYANKGDVLTPRILIRCEKNVDMAMDAYIKREIAKCKQGMDCKDLGSVAFGNNTFSSYRGESYVVENVCFAKKTSKNDIVTFCDQGLKNDVLRSKILESFVEF